MKLFRRKGDGEEPPAEVYAGLRRQVLNLTPDQLDEESFADAPIVTLLMETGYPEAVATLVAVVDGATSLYFSNGGGFIGCGEHATVAEASERWLASGQDVLPKLSAISDPALPAQGRTQFLAVTPGGLRGSVAQEEELGAGRHDLSPLFHAGQDVITQIRLTQGG